jgi:hypothetical protein
LVPGLGLFPGLGYGGGRQKMTAALGGQPGVPSPSPKALRDLRRRLGAAPAKALSGVPGRAGGPAVRARGAVRPVPDGGLRRLHLDQGAGHAAEPWLAGEDEVIVTCAGGTRYCGSGG